ncbi:hypothetical protein MAQ5080_00687 [Marinomonas aquimarina]|uniref:DUF2789 domain-containing protein n=1 Tax=Marinomonas aquimarina TaxID=295068 RepID=A0A1A8T448_9GAMM|nr:DUF2789 domain-containing protein [Marinomonas aquimarina]SBS26971.1 hypothetical protein MAQ5080_00687 [Marinomonas aquimarina]
METQIHTINALFEQLGLDGSKRGIEQFVVDSSPIPSHVQIWDAPIWTESQASALKQMKAEDADWSEVVDQLDVMLRA